MNQIVFHIGFHKTASSWFQQLYFSKHPELKLINNYREPWKDPFISYLINPKLPFSKEKCIALFLKATEKIEQKIIVISAERLSGHPISGGCDNIQIAERIKNCFPDAKIIIVKRETRSFVESVYKQMVAEGYVGTIHQFINTDTWKAKGPSINYFKTELLVKTYLDLFSQQKVSILKYEDFLENKNVFINSLNIFLQVSTINSIYKNSETINRSLQNKRIRALRILNYFRSTSIYPNPIIKINSEFLFKLSKVSSLLFSNKKFVDNSLWKIITQRVN